MMSGWVGVKYSSTYCVHLKCDNIRLGANLILLCVQFDAKIYKWSNVRFGGNLILFVHDVEI